MRWKTLPGLILCLAAGLVLTSCYEVDIESAFEEDGSALHTYTATIDRASLEELGEMASEFDTSDFDESAEEARAEGFEAEVIDTDEHMGIRLSKTVEDNADLGQVLNDIFTAGGEGEEAVTAFTGTFTRDGNVYTVNLTVDGNLLFGEEIPEEEGVSPEMLSSFITMTYSVRLPGEVRVAETDGRILPDGRVQWDLPLTGTATFNAVSETKSDRNWLLLAGIAGLLTLFIAGAVGLFLFLFLRGRRSPEPAPAAYPETYGPGPDDPTAQIPTVESPPSAQKKPDDLNF